jgi:hypothetical protein
MDADRPGRAKSHSYTVAALLGVFVVAILIALASRLLPGGLSRVVRRALRRGDETGSSPD